MGKCCVFLVLLFFSVFAGADTTYSSCEINNGEVGNCIGSANKQNVPIKRNTGGYEYWDCNIDVGSVTGCMGPSTVDHFPVKQSNGIYLDCFLVAGSPTSCTGRSNVSDFPVAR